MLIPSLIVIVAITALVLGIIAIVIASDKCKGSKPTPTPVSVEPMYSRGIGKVDSGTMNRRLKSRVTCRKGNGRNVIFQTWKTSTLPNELRFYSVSWQALNPEYKYMLFGDKECRHYIKTTFGEREATAFDTLAPGAFKADLFRYCVLYHEGGVYSDVDVEPMVPIEEFVSPEDDFVSVQERHGIPGVYQAFMVCQRPGLPFLKLLIDRIVQYTNENYYPPMPAKDSQKEWWTTVLSITGPVALAECISEYSGIPAPFKPGRSTIDENTTMKLLTFKSDLEVQDDGGRVVLNTKVPEYNGGDSIQYDIMFRDHNIYNKL